MGTTTRLKDIRDLESNKLSFYVCNFMKGTRKNIHDLLY